MKKLIILLSVTGVFISYGFAQPVSLDIAGLVYYGMSQINGSEDAFPVLDKTPVVLSKRTAAGTWEPFAATATDINGKYVFADVNVGAGGLFENSDWFRVAVDAKGHLPAKWPPWLSKVQWRFAYKEPRPGDLPDPGIIRVDVIFLQNYAGPLAEPVTYPFGFKGRLVDFTAQGQAYTPDMGIWGMPPEGVPGHEATCPAGVIESLVPVSGCRGGDWWSVNEPLAPAEKWEDAAFARYVFFQSETGVPPERYEIARGYSYWHPDWPYWALFGFPNEAYVVIDFVDTTLPE